MGSWELTPEKTMPKLKKYKSVAIPAIKCPTQCGKPLDLANLKLSSSTKSSQNMDKAEALS